MKIFLKRFLKSSGVAMVCMAVWIPQVRGQVLIGASGVPEADAMLELRSSNRGFLPPRINLTSSTMWLNNVQPADGMVVYSVNDAFGKGLCSWHNGRWNKLTTKSLSLLTYARLKGSGFDDGSKRIKWDTVYTRQPAGLGQLWSVNAPTEVKIRTAGLYIVSASYRIENSAQSNDIYIYVNGAFAGIKFYPISVSDYKNNITSNKGLTYSGLIFLNANDIITIGGQYGPTSQTLALGLGTTQLTITQIPKYTF